MPDIASWLAQLGLSRHTEAFVRHGIGFDVLSDLTEGDLRELEIPLGDRRRLLKAIASCGAAAPAPADAGNALALASSPERRHLTVMFCDLVGSTALSAMLDPEDLHRLIGGFQVTCRSVIEQFDGYVARYMGDGILVYFGYPVAHEDDAERAARAGLGIIDGVSTLDAGPRTAPGVELSVRIGVATGIVVVGDIIGEGASEQRAVVGQTPNLAARLQALARPNEVVVSSQTHRLLGPRFDYEDLGRHELKGIPSLVRAWRVVRPRLAETRFAAGGQTRLARLVGRGDQLARLERAWARAVAGTGTTVLLVGEAGIGKSHLCETFLAMATASPATVIRLQCSPYHVSSAFHPVIAELQRSAGFHHEDLPGVRLDKLEILLGEPGPARDEAVALIATLLSVPTNARYAPLGLGAREQRERTMSALTKRLVDLSRHRPTVLLIEDAHWIDPSSEEFLATLIACAPTARLFLLVTSRPEYQPDWRREGHVGLEVLDRLSHPQVEAMLDDLGGSLTSQLRTQIAERADGVPLYVEELTRSMLDSEAPGGPRDGNPADALSVPSSLHDSLVSRLDRLAMGKEVAQLGAVIGREFTLPLLAEISSESVAALTAGVGQLVDANLVVRSPHGLEDAMMFRHTLVRDAAYESLLKSKRQELHARIARGLVDDTPSGAAVPELVAHHFTAAGLAEEAIGFWLKAARRATKRSANREALAHIERGFECLATLAESSARDHLELYLQSMRGEVSVATSGHASPDVRRAFTRAYELCASVGGDTDLFHVVWGITAHHLVKGDIRSNGKLSARLLAIAQKIGNSANLLVAHTSRCLSLYYAGEFEAALEHLERVRVLYHRADHAQLAHTHGVDRKMVALQHGTWVLWKLGYPDQASQLEEELNAHARELAHPYSLAQALTAGASVYMLRREPERMFERAREGIELAERHGYPVWTDHGGFWVGWALAEQGRLAEGLSYLRAGLATYRRSGTGSSLPKFLGLLADKVAAAGNPSEGLALLEQALGHVKKWGERCTESETYRLKGKLLMLRGDSDDDVIEACLARALEVAREQNARGWELRAASTLAARWCERDLRKQAYDLLAPVYEWFREGLDTPDLVEARQILDRAG